MTVRPKLMIGAGIAIAGLGLIGAGAGATFTTQVSGSTSITSGDLGLSLNGAGQSALLLGVDANHLGSHFAPISRDLVLKNTGSLDMASTFLSVSATGCSGGDGAALAQALRVRLTDETNDGKLIYDGPLCSLADTTHQASVNDKQGFTVPSVHGGVGDQLPGTLQVGQSIHYRLLIQAQDQADGLPSSAQNMRTSVNLVFSGFDY